MVRLGAARQGYGNCYGQHLQAFEPDRCAAVCNVVRIYVQAYRLSHHCRLQTSPV